ncbi:membrane protein required for colicin V production [Bradyrhizobium sp. LB1.3]|jgi:membrane protein required for colicin V production|uniref:CvpA family protein n=1 Tax=unclassified Bradyrhizobium TaxID=2631580 RepID=UPI001FF9D4DD|nr:MULTISPECIES: CvpA family protein [unclassified Bradyrhizobium]MCK1338280.1 CvpA family protein [Bradyrhizobium sp. 38]MCK1481188.1 CvpA family protein [Bradyrhizobium sp. 197]MCK1777698.1 CvpA family protein [Bradyrhizobium sp. 132]
MNSFDLAVYAALAIAIGFGFRTGLLGSAMTILAYLLAAPIAVALMPLIVPQVAGNPNSPLLQNWIWFFGIFVVVGMLFGYLGRLALSDTIREAGIGDRLGGAALGAIRVGLVATTLVLVFDQIVPANRQPPFLAGSHLRPLFSAAGQMGFKSLPPEATSAIDRLKQERRI